MDSRLILIALIYSILNSIFVILPQFEENQNVKSQLNSENVIQIISQDSISKISDIELISTVDMIITESGLKKTSYEYNRENQENLQAHIIILSLEGENHNIIKFTDMISKIKGIKINEFSVTKDINKINANLSLSVIGGEYEKDE
ncbi:hypothetical protein [Proteocatella sphenisci]|uniref:hypothetical protein n=1 Tax=Proteocatella sphenisci TaxID=181070 RepID=UPI00048BCF83|nr:hypothetical protein [Proteocatella sphenisci]